MATSRVIALVPAAGSGKRFGGEIKKPFVSLCGKPVIVRTLEILESISAITEIIPVLHAEDMAYGTALCEEYGISKVRRIVPGGAERQDSVMQALSCVDTADCLVLIHDGVRPLIEPAVIMNAISECMGYDGVVVGIPIKDTVKEVSDGTICQTLRREMLWAVQTPQVFPCKVLRDAYEKAMREGFYSTDDSALVERYGGKVRIVSGSSTNIKITTPEDLEVAALLLERRGCTA